MRINVAIDLNIYERKHVCIILEVTVQFTEISIIPCDSQSEAPRKKYPGTLLLNVGQDAPQY